MLWAYRQRSYLSRLQNLLILPLVLLQRSELLKFVLLLVNISSIVFFRIIVSHYGGYLAALLIPSLKIFLKLISCFK